jgi:ADP-heptose:LPS heptosyltransferase
MSYVLDSIGQGAHVVVVRLRSLGDCVLTTPAIQILKSSRPDLEISVVVEERFAAVFEENPDISAILPPTLKGVAFRRAELCINFHGGSRSLVLTAASRARFRAGFAHYRASSVYNVRIPTAQEILGVNRKVHTAEHLASAMFYLGASRMPIPRARLSAERKRVERPYVVLHPFAAMPEKTWPADRFLQLARCIEDQHGLEPVFVAGPGDDTTPFSGFRVVAGAPLREIKSLLAGASLFIGNDSGPAHMAAAFGIPVAVMFGPSDPVVWAPWQVEAEVLTGNGSINSITIDEATRAVEQLRVPR